MSNYNNMSDADLLSVLNSMADRFEQGLAVAEPVQTDIFNNSNGQDVYQPMPVFDGDPNIIDTEFVDPASQNMNPGFEMESVIPLQQNPVPFTPVTPVRPVQPTPQATQQFVEPQPVNVQSWEEMEIELVDVTNSYGSSYSEPEQDMPVMNPLYTMDKDGNIIFSNMRPTQQSNAFRITPEKAFAPDYGVYGFVEKRRKALFESEFGISYSYKKSWEALLQSVVRQFRDARAVNNFGIKDGLILAKNLEVDPHNFTDDKLGITLYDLINFHILFKELPNIEMLVLDSAATQRMVIAYGDRASDIWKVFQECPSLRVLRIHTSTGWKDHNRSDFGATAGTLEQELQEARAKAELQYKFDVINPRKSEMPKGYAYRVKENAKEMRNHSFGVAKEAFMAPKPKLFSSVLYTGIGIGLAGVGLVSSMLYGAKLLLKPR